MFRTRFEKILLVAPDVFPDQLITYCRSVKHISMLGDVFPCLYELKPEMIIFDYDYVGTDIEKVLRRININQFYNKLKVCCYKRLPDEKIDSSLKSLGVDYLFYPEDFANSPKGKTRPNNFSSIFDATILKWVANVSH